MRTIANKKITPQITIFFHEKKVTTKFHDIKIYTPAQNGLEQIAKFSAVTAMNIIFAN